MELEFLPLEPAEQECFSAHGVSESDRELILRLAPKSFEWLWRAIVPQPLTSSQQVPDEHWSNQCDCHGPSYYQYRMAAGDPDDPTKWQAKWEKDLIKFFNKAFEFGLADDVFLANCRHIYSTKWNTFVTNADAFCPWHDVTIVVKQNAKQFGLLVEDYHSVGRGTRPRIEGFDSKRFVPS